MLVRGQSPLPFCEQLERCSQGGCGFFEWADQASGSQPSSQPDASQKRTRPEPAAPEDADPDVVQMTCNCGVPTVRLQAKTEKNNGRWGAVQLLNSQLYLVLLLSLPFGASA